MSDPNQSWKGQFSLGSLLPARHPPLHVSHPHPPPPPPLTQRVAGYHTTNDTLRCPSPVRSAYPSPSVYPETPYGPGSARLSHLPPLRHAGRRPSPASTPVHSSPTKRKHRPPPLDIAKIKAIYPTERVINDASPPRYAQPRGRGGTRTPPEEPVSPPILPPLKDSVAAGMSRWKALAEARNMLEGGSRMGQVGSGAGPAQSEGTPEQGRGATRKARRPEREERRRASDDPFDVAIIEPGLQYPSWHPPAPAFAQPGRSNSRSPSSQTRSTHWERACEWEEKTESEAERRVRNLQNLQPGQVLPRHMLDSFPQPDRYADHARSERDTVAGETYDSVLHNVLLTPTYLRNTPSPRSLLSNDPADRNGRYASRARTGVRDTLVAKARRMSKAPLALLGKRYAEESRSNASFGSGLGSGAGLRSISGSMRAMKAREEEEMDRFRRARPLMLTSESSEQLSSSTVPRGQRALIDAYGTPTHRSPVRKEYQDRSRDRYDDEEAKVEHHHHHAYYNAAALPSKQALIEWDREKERQEAKEARGSCWTFNITKGMDPKKVKKQQRKRKICMVLLILLVVGAIVGICLAFLLRRPASSSPSTPSSDSSPSSSDSAATSATVSAGSPVSGSQTSGASPSPSATPPSRLETCMSQYNALTGDTSSYACSECVPLLLGTTNDFTQDSGGGNGTGVGAALQFCTLRDIVNAGDASAFGSDGGAGWGQRDVCRWRGVQCDSRGRVEEINLAYPAVPYRIPTTISQIPTLKKLQITGNSSIPSGPFPHQLVTANLTSLTLTDTALQGPITSAPWGDAKELTTLYLANNPILGSGVPDLKGNDKLVTLAMTGQLIGSVDVGKLPASLTYLDLSYNSLNGQVPSFAELNNLRTLYLEHNSYTSAPPGLPASLRDLRLNNNPSLAGSLPSQICGMSGLSECDLRGTGMGGNGTSCGRCRFGSG